ncbi:hypothetical protein PS874_02000 [Pseudomonas fluorescens]|nr:hypothetical protein PS874_02000 [Pseudomonas fluorescens]
MTTAFDAPLNESLRDAMLALYLHEAVPNDAYLIEQELTQRIKTADDLYEFWLLDVLVSQNVPTSPVACAIASLQQLVNGMLLNMEPGYQDDSLTPAQTKAWRDGLNRYPIWAAIQQLHYFPDIYLAPTLRLTKTASFEQLENDINQAQIQPDTVQAAVLAYLARFEEIANLKVCNGYIDGEDFANSTYYFIGKSPAENVYYWRSLDMSQRPLKTPAQGPGIFAPKFDKPLPNAWSDWKKANVPISEKALEHTIRPCWFNNRLFVIWAEVELQDSEAIISPTEGKADTTIKVYPRFRLYASYKKYDDSWSTPRIYIENYCQTADLVKKTLEEIERETQTIAVYDHSTSPESMFFALYSNYIPVEVTETEIPGSKDGYDFLRTVQIDKNFNVTSMFPADGYVKPQTLAPEDEENSERHVRLIGYIFANGNKNAGRFQYWLPSGARVFGEVVGHNPTEKKDTWDFGNWQSRIKTCEKNVDLIYDRANSNIQLTVKLENSFPDDQILKFSIYDRYTTFKELFRVTLVFSASDNNEWIELHEGSSIEPVGTDFMNVANAMYQFNGEPGLTNLIVDIFQSDRFSVQATPQGDSASLQGKKTSRKILDRLIHNEGVAFVSFRRIVNSVEASLGLDLYPDFKVSGNYGYQLVVLHPLNVQLDDPAEKFEDMRRLNASSIVSKLPKDSVYTISFSINQTTHQPDGWPPNWWLLPM